MTDLPRRTRAFRAAYRAAWAVRRIVWLLPFPHMNGAMAAVWHGDRVLMVRNSYNSFYTLPGGRLNAGESHREAAARELGEETGVRIGAGALTAAHVEHLGHALRSDRVEIFETVVTARPEVAPDAVEIAETHWWTPDEAFQRALYGPVRRYLRTRRSSP